MPHARVVAVWMVGPPRGLSSVREIAHTSPSDWKGRKDLPRGRRRGQDHYYETQKNMNVVCLANDEREIEEVATGLRLLTRGSAVVGVSLRSATTSCGAASTNVANANGSVLVRALGGRGCPCPRKGDPGRGALGGGGRECPGGVPPGECPS